MISLGVFQMAEWLKKKNPSAFARDARDRSSIRGQESTLKQEMATHSVFLPGKFCWLKNMVKTLKQRVVLFGGNVQDSEPRRQNLSTPEKTTPRRQERRSSYIEVCNKWSRQSEHQRSGIKFKKCSILCVGRCKLSGVTKFIPFICTSKFSKSGFNSM